MLVCIEDNQADGSGCSAATEPDLCKSATFTDAPGFSLCVPELAELPTTTEEMLEIFPTDDCAGVFNSTCNDQRADFVAAMGCPICTDAANDGAAVGELCTEGATEAACNDLNPLSDEDTSASASALAAAAAKFGGGGGDAPQLQETGGSEPMVATRLEVPLAKSPVLLGAAGNGKKAAEGSATLAAAEQSNNFNGAGAVGGLGMVAGVAGVAVACIGLMM